MKTKTFKAIHKYVKKILNHINFFHCIRFNYRLAIESCMKRQDIVDYKLNLHSAFDSYCKRCRQKKEIIFINEKFNIYIPKLRRLKSKSAVMNQKDKSPPMKIKRLSSRMNQKGKSAVMKLKRVDSSLLKKETHENQTSFKERWY